MTRPTPTPLRRLNDLLAAAHRAAEESGDTHLADRVSNVWKVVERRTEQEEAVLHGDGTVSA